MSNNKKNQTFGDLFSNIENNSDNKKERISFNAINNEIKESEKFNDSDNIENTKDSFNDLLKESKKEDNKEEVNIFTTSKEDEKPEEDNKEEVNIFTTPKEDEKLEEDNKEEENIFITPKEDEKAEEDNKEEVNIFTTPKEDEKPEKDNKEEENIFTTPKEDEKPEEDNKEVTHSETDRKENLENILNQNPFFIESENETVENENPFFDNTISLVEKNNPSKTEKNTKIDTSSSKHFNVKIVSKKEPIPKFIIGVISYAIFIWLLLIGIALLVYVADIKIRQAKGDYSSPTYNAYVVLTGSMLPDIQVYDVVVTKKTDPKDLKEGDIITFASSDTRFLNTIITHRIIKKYYDAEKKEYTFQSKGDNNNVADSALVQSNNIYGKVILKIPKLGYLQDFLASKGGWIIAILLPCLAVISYDVVKLAKGLKRKKYKNIKVQK